MEIGTSKIGQQKKSAKTHQLRSHFSVVTFQPRVLLEDDLLPLDPHVTAPLGRLVVLHPTGPVLVVLALRRHVRLLATFSENQRH